MKRIVPDEAQLHALASKHFQSGLREARVVHHHCNTHVHLTLDDSTQVIVRICDGPYWTEKARQIERFRRERYAWEYLSQLRGILTPRVLAIETDEAILPCPFLVITHVPGTPMDLVFPTLTQAEQLSLIEQLGGLARSIHTLDINLTSLPSEMCPWAGHRVDLLIQLRLLAQQGLISPPTRAKVEQWVERYSSQLAAMDDDLVFLHGDFYFGNVLLQRDNGSWRVSGLVDAELAGAGPRGRELRALESFSFRGLRTPGMREAFLCGYGEGYSREEYKLAYLTHELDPDFPNEELVQTIEASDGREGLDLIAVFEG